MRVLPAELARKPRRRKQRSGRRWHVWVHIVRYLRACMFLFNIRTLLMAAFACMMVYLCQTTIMDLRFRVEFSIISVGTVFPLVFSIQQAYSRREEALRNLSMMKGLLMGMYFCNRDWDLSDGVAVRSNLGNDEAPHAVEFADTTREFFSTLKLWLSGSTTYESEAEFRMLYGTTHLRKDMVKQLLGEFFRAEEVRGKPRELDDDDDADDLDAQALEFAEQDPHWQLYYKLYDCISRISVLNEKLMVAGLCGKAGEGGFSRLAAYLAKTVEVLERLRCLREYRTPFMLRSVSFILTLATIVMAAPYFAWMCSETRWDEDTSGSCPAGYFSAVLYVLVISTLTHVQVALENPFDGIGMDDVFINMDREFSLTVRRYARSRTEASLAAANSTALDVSRPDRVAAATAGPATPFEDVKAMRVAQSDVGCTPNGAAGDGIKAYAILVSDASLNETGAAAAIAAASVPVPRHIVSPGGSNRSGGGGGGNGGGGGGADAAPRPSSSASRGSHLSKASKAGGKSGGTERPPSAASTRAWEPVNGAPNAPMD